MDQDFLPQNSMPRNLPTPAGNLAMFGAERSIDVAERSRDQESSNLEARNSEQEVRNSKPGNRGVWEEELLSRRSRSENLPTPAGNLAMFGTDRSMGATDRSTELESSGLEA